MLRVAHLKKVQRALATHNQSRNVAFSAAYTEAMYDAWKKDPTSVHVSWAAYFQNLDRNVEPAFCSAPAPGTSIPSFNTGASAAASMDNSRIVQLVRSYQTRGHIFAKVNPLGLPSELPFVTPARAKFAKDAPLITLERNNFSESEMTKAFDVRVPGVAGFLSPEARPLPLHDLVKRLEEIYCGPIGYEYMHIADPDVCNFFRERIETPNAFQFSKELKRKILVRTARAQMFENFCATKFSTAKRFGLDGAETMIVGLKAISKQAASIGIDSIVMGMPHRGRLNLLMNVMHKPMQQMMGEFQGVTGFGGTEWGNTGDVKYHLGVEFEHWDEDAKRYVRMGLLPNPSHLEAVNPLVAGQARAQQYFLNDQDRSRVLPIVLHGDASIAGQGVVYETTQMSLIPNYAIGGTLHIVVNNQVGFTTDPKDSGSGKYCTDLAKSIDAPILHVNADDPEAVTHAFNLALEYRQKFKGDIFIDLVGYRRFGHNELDMPKFTQPKMYSSVGDHPSVLDVYAKKLTAEGIVSAEEVEAIKSNIAEFYNAEYEKSKSFNPSGVKHANKFIPNWKDMKTPDEIAIPKATGIDIERLKELGNMISTLPDNFTAHPSIKKTFIARLEAISKGEGIDFGLGENLAYASLLQEGFHIRLGGQDVQRGTFSHRHAVVHDQKTFQTHSIFSVLNTPHKIEVCNSLLSEYAALGFELGYSLEHPNTLSIWEAQFGDFFNGAQIIVDQFITSGEVKWGRQTGLVMRLPHGYDGQGPEHSSARMERFLQACDDREDVIHPENWHTDNRSVVQQHNIQVVNCSTPAQEFHVIRRQLHRDFRKPLIMFSPKRLLKYRGAFSDIAEFGAEKRFQTYIPETEADVKEEDVERLIMCSGQVYYDLINHRKEIGLKNVAIARVEQLSPFPYEKVIDDMKRYPNMKSLVWTQEEPMNMGPWFYTSKRLESSLKYLNKEGLTAPVYAGRDVAASPAVGDSKLHNVQLKRLLNDSFDLKRKDHSYYEDYIQ